MTTITPRRRPYTARLPADERRNQLLDAAIQIIVRDGYEGISIDAIAREAGVTRPVVYSVYDGLGPLLRALLDRQEARALSQLFTALPADLLEGDAEQAIAGAVHRLAETVIADPLTWRPILFANQSSPPEVRRRIAADWERVRQQLARLIAMLAGPAGVRDDGTSKLDVEVLSHAMMATLEHFGRLLLDDPGRFDAERLVAAVRRVMRRLAR
jgi:AcrR family transcriptional regulator